MLRILGPHCVEIPPIVHDREWPPEPPEFDRLRDWRLLATIDEFAGRLSGDRGVEIQRAVAIEIEADNRRFEGAATLSRQSRA